jgi:hypothetical protein
VRDTLSFVPVTNMNEVLLEALETPEKLDLEPPKPKGGKRKKSSAKPRNPQTVGTHSSPP